MKGKVIRGYKGFDKDLKCRDFQYEVGKEYECKRSVACKEGFHFCENPIDVLYYYSPCEYNGLNRFCEVEGSGEFDRKNDKLCCTKIKIIREIGIDDLIKEGGKLNLSNIINNNEEERSFVTNYKERSGTMVTNDYSIVRNKGCGSVATNVGDKTFAVNFSDLSVANNTGDCSVASTMGKCTVATNTGKFSISDNAGDNSIAANTGVGSEARNKGYNSVAVNTGNSSTASSESDISVAVNAGYCSIATNTGDQSIAANIGWSSSAVNTGNRSVAISIGNFSSVNVEGKNSVAIADGYGTVAKGSLGCWIVLIEREGYHAFDRLIKNVKAFEVDGEIVKPDTYYKLVNGELVEVKKN